MADPKTGGSCGDPVGILWGSCGDPVGDPGNPPHRIPEGGSPQDPPQDSHRIPQEPHRIPPQDRGDRDSHRIPKGFPHDPHPRRKDTQRIPHMIPTGSHRIPTGGSHRIPTGFPQEPLAVFGVAKLADPKTGGSCGDPVGILWGSCRDPVGDPGNPPHRIPTGSHRNPTGIPRIPQGLPHHPHPRRKDTQRIPHMIPTGSYRIPTGGSHRIPTGTLGRFWGGQIG